MADFCKTCSIETWGKDHGDLANLSTEQDTNEGLYAVALCEGCGDILVDHTGKKVTGMTGEEEESEK